MSGILVTGGAGFIGSDFVRKTAESGKHSRIFVLDSLTYAANLSSIDNLIQSNSIEFIKADVNDTNSYKKVLSECNSVVHFAAESHVDRSIDCGDKFIETNILGTYNLLEVARNFNSVRTIVVSTDEVYGSIEMGESRESDPQNPSSIYSASKASADLIALANASTHRQDILITRCCNNYGPFQNEEKLIPNLICRLISGQNVGIYGDGTNVREWIYVSDHVSAIEKVLEKGKSGNVYNIGSGERLSNLDVARMVIQELDLEESRIEFTTDRKGHDRRYALSSERVRNLGWEPRTKFVTGLRETISWYRSKSEVNN